MSAALADHLPQRVRRTVAAVLRPNTIMAAPTSANSVQAVPSIDTSHQQPDGRRQHRTNHLRGALRGEIERPPRPGCCRTWRPYWEVQVLAASAGSATSAGCLREC